LPVGLIWGEQDGEVLFHPDEDVTGAIRTDCTGGKVACLRRRA
jgi:hypothetical protein